MSSLALVPLNVMSLANAPTLPTLRSGDIYYNTSTGLMVYNGSSWVAVGSFSTVANIDGGMSDSVAPYMGGRASTTATQTINGGSA